MTVLIWLFPWLLVVRCADLGRSRNVILTTKLGSAIESEDDEARSMSFNFTHTVQMWSARLLENETLAELLQVQVLVRITSLLNLDSEEAI